MKNIKSIIFACLAAVLVLGITACQEPMTYKTPNGLTATVTKDYIVGEEFDPSTASVVVYYTDGSSDTLSGSQVKYDITGSTDGTIKENTKITFTYGAATNDVYVVGHSVSSVELANLPTEAAWDADESKAVIDPSEITVTATLDNGTTRALTEGEYVITPSATGATAGAEGVAATATVTVYQKPVTTVNGIKDWKVDVASAADPDFNPEDTTITLEVEVDYGKTGSSATTGYIGDAVTLKIYLKDSKGGKQTVDISDLIVEDNKTLSTTMKVERTKQDFTVYYKEDISKTETFSIVAGKNYATGVTLAGYADKFTPTAGTAVTYQNLKFNEPTYAVKFVEGDTAWAASATNVVFIDSATPVAGETFQPRIQVTFGKDGANAETKILTLPAVAIPAANQETEIE